MFSWPFVVLAIHCTLAATEGPVVDTCYGKIRGQRTTTRGGRTVAEFLGVRYAKATSGPLKFLVNHFKLLLYFIILVSFENDIIECSKRKVFPWYKTTKLIINDKKCEKYFIENVTVFSLSLLTSTSKFLIINNTHLWTLKWKKAKYLAYEYILNIYPWLRSQVWLK